MRGSRGSTLIEVVIVLAILGLLIGPLSAAISLTMSQVPKEGAKLAVENRHQLARYWLTRDANSAETFTPGTGANYGTFTWRDFSRETTVTYSVIYSYSSALKALMREEQYTGGPTTTFHVAGDILSQSDVAFAWNPGQRKVTVVITPTSQEAPAVGDITRTATLVVFLRYEAEGVVSPPGATPIPTPPPGSVTYYVVANPTLLTGTYVSGNAASLHDADTNFYTVSSETVGGSKVVSWEAYSQTMTTPPTINQIEVRFTGKVDKQNVTMQLFVKDASGYPTISDSGFTFTEANTEITHSFYLDAAKVSYINSTRVVYLKVKATASATFNLYSNQVLFIASP